MRRETHIPTLDGLRAIAFLLVFVAHSGLDKTVPGGFGVTVFFFLSGYLITTLLRNEAEKTGTVSLKRFYLRRSFRILPPMYLTLALSALFASFGMIEKQGNVLGFTSAIFYAFNYVSLLAHHKVLLPTGAGLLWSLMIEEHFYFIFPLMYLLFVRHRISVRRQTIILITLCGGALAWRYILVLVLHTPLDGVPRWTYSATDARFDSILWGCLLAIRNNPWLNPRRTWRRSGVYAGLGVGVILGTLLLRESVFRETLRYSLQGIALYPIFHYCVAAHKKFEARWLEWGPLRWLGSVSYSMYLSHVTALNLWHQRLPHSALLVKVLGFATASLYSFAMLRLVENPLRRVRQDVERKFCTPVRRGENKNTMSGEQVPTEA